MYFIRILSIATYNLIAASFVRNNCNFPGQSIGKGLHVRLNLQTGEKEAKFLSEEDRNTPGMCLNTQSKRVLKHPKSKGDFSIRSS